MIKITDNFLDTDTFNTLSNELLMPSFPWYASSIDAKDHEGNALRNMQLVHYFYENNVAMDGCQMLFPVMQKIDPLAVLRIKANLTLQHDTQLKHDLHIDITNASNPFLMTSILYMNTNNGYTMFEDGTKIDSVANRMLFFDASKLHNSSTTSDAPGRFNINLNFR